MPRRLGIHGLDAILRSGQLAIRIALCKLRLEKEVAAISRSDSNAVKFWPLKFRWNRGWATDASDDHLVRARFRRFKRLREHERQRLSLMPDFIILQRKKTVTPGRARYRAFGARHVFVGQDPHNPRLG
jgi:hypothetical protein